MATLYGTRGRDTIDGTASADRIYGGPLSDPTIDTGNDSLSGLGGTDILFGYGGNDTLNGGDGYDSLDGGAGDDSLDMGADGGAALGGTGDDTLTGGTGADDLNGGTGRNSLAGGDGNDRITSVLGAVDAIDGGAGTDQAEIDRSNATVDLTFAMSGVANTTTLEGDGTTVVNVELITLRGGSGDDRFTTAFYGAFYGNAGDDTLNGGGGGLGTLGNDTLDGGSGDDSLFGGSGRDRLYGGADHDTLDGGDTRDDLDGGTRNNVLNGGSGDDTIVSNLGAVDTIDGGFGERDTALVDRSNATVDLTFNLTSSRVAAILQGDGTSILDVEKITLYVG